MKRRSFVQNTSMPPMDLVCPPEPNQISELDDLLHSSEPDATLFAETFCLHQQIPPDCERL